MHQNYLVLFKFDPDHPPLLRDWVARTEETLGQENFVSGDGWFGGGKCDWFEIGGHWNGILGRETPEGREVLKHIKKLYKKYEISMPSEATSLTEDQAKLYRTGQIWWKKAMLPLIRQTAGKPDLSIGQIKSSWLNDRRLDATEMTDAMVLTEGLIKNLKEEYRSTDVLVIDEYNDCVEDEIIVERLDKEHIGGVLVMIDYHV